MECTPDPRVIPGTSRLRLLRTLRLTASRWVLLTALGGTWLSACTVPPRDTQAPRENTLPSLVAPVTHVSLAPEPPTDWWTAFHDARLDAIEHRALAANPDVAKAIARLASAEQAVVLAAGANGISMTANAALTRQRLSANGIFPPPLGGSTFTQSDLDLALHRDIDLWNRNTDLLHAAVGRAQAAAMGVDEARVLLARSVATSYFTLGTDLLKQRWAEQAKARTTRLAHLAKIAFKAGATGRPALVNARIARAQATLAVDQADTAVARDRLILAALAGHGAHFAATLDATPPLSLAPPALPTQLPLDAVYRRPDIRAAQASVQASSAAVGAARAGFYPDIELNGQVGFESLSLAKLLTAASAADSLGIAIHLPLFHPATLRAALGRARAGYDAAVDHYNAVLLTAAREVSMALTEGRAADAQTVQYRALLADLRRERQMARTRFQTGSDSVLPVLHAEVVVLNAEINGVDIARDRLIASVDLMAALGGHLPPAAPDHHP